MTDGGRVPIRVAENDQGVIWASCAPDAPTQKGVRKASRRERLQGVYKIQQMAPWLGTGTQS